MWLNPFHSHFILVDDGKDKFGAEIQFRAELERTIVKKENIPIFLLVLEGGINTLKTVSEALDKDKDTDKIPVILVAVRSLAVYVKNESQELLLIFKGN